MKRSRLLAILDWSVRVGRLFGIPIHLHISLLFFLIAAFPGRSLGLWHSVEYILAVILSILVHELGHALTAKHYRLRDLSITLHGFGGFAISSGYRTITQDLVIILAGPATTLILGGILFGIGSYGTPTAALGSEALLQFFLIRALGSLNLLLGVLNLIPTFPLDGGQALAAFLSIRRPEKKAKRLVGHLGLVLSSVLLIACIVMGESFVAFFGLIGIFGSVMYLLNSGGIRFGEAAADRRERKEAEEARKRNQEKQDRYLNDIRTREKEREERERLRKLLEASLDE